MIQNLKKFINNFLLKTINYKFVDNEEYTVSQNSIKTDIVLEKDFLEINDKINKIYKQNTLNETNYSAYQAVKNALNLKLKGSIVECGVYQGQKINYFLETLNTLKVNNIDVYIIDTFEGMTEPSNKDLQMITKKVMKKKDLSASLESVKDRIFQSNYPREKLHFIKMDVRNQNDLRNIVEGNIIILRLDTDFYDSTLASLNSLYSKVVKNGFIIHDDYGHWKGHYDACQKFYRDNNINPLLIRTCRKERIEIKY
tara:strand:+ start:395 stop:1159 length:765 start_codon:yes stop_codon:yes gene_type:complete